MVVRFIAENLALNQLGRTRSAKEIAGPLLVELGYEADPEW